MKPWTAPQPDDLEGPPVKHGPPSLSLGRKHRPPHEILFEGLQHLSAQIEHLEAEVTRLRELAEQKQDKGDNAGASDDA